MSGILAICLVHPIALKPHKREKHQLPIYTLSIFGAKLYIVNSLDLVLAVQKQAKALSFMHLVTRMVGPVSNASAEACQILERSLDNAESGTGVVPEFFKLNYVYLAPGAYLDTMNRTAGRTSGRRPGCQTPRHAPNF